MSSARRPAWFLDEQVTIGTENVDTRHVARYDAKEDAAAESELELLTSYGVDSDATVVEFGPGTGQLAMVLARRAARFVAVEPSQAMPAHLRATVAGMRPAATLKVIEGGVLTYEHHGAQIISSTRDSPCTTCQTSGRRWP